MRLPNAEKAVVDIAKLLDYSLNAWHDVGQHKARVFQSALGLTMTDAEWLREQLLAVVHTNNAAVGALSPFDQKYVIDFAVTRGEKSAIVRSAWIVENGTDFPRLTSCYVKRSEVRQ